MKFFLISKITSKLKNEEIKKICKLKDTHWKHGMASQLKWYKKNVKKNDINNIIKYSDQIIGYTLLRKKSSNINYQKKKFFFI